MNKETPNSFFAHLFAPSNNPIVIGTSITYQDMHAVHHALCTPGFHALKFHDIDAGRTMINTCLRYGNKIAGYLNAQDAILDSGVINLYDLLKQNNYAPHSIEEFFIDYVHIDLLWIERTPGLEDCPWFSMFEKNIIDFNIQNTIPIILVSEM